jgi:hypothetical protein
MSRTLSLAVLTAVLLGCNAERDTVTPAAEARFSQGLARASAGLRTVSFPEEDPGPPFYARVATLLDQIFHDDEYVAIPFYRDPTCVPGDFDLLSSFHLPDEHGPGAFGCDLLVHGRFLIEPDAPHGTFPVQVVTRGAAGVWFVPWNEFQSAMADGSVTMSELRSLNPLQGTADHFHEMLQPRMDDHRVVITSSGRLDDGRRFQFNVTHLGDTTQSLLIRIH